MMYLTNDQKQMAMSLYRETFLEDSDSFISYYQSEVLSRNEVLAEIAGDQVISMIHQNPYRVKLMDEIYEVNYLVAVATAKEYRRQGYMRALMQKTLQDLYDKEQPFCYLQPANPAYYEPFDFVFISYYEKNEYGDVNRLSRETVSSDELMSNKLLKDWILAYFNQYEVACVRDEAYFERLSKELLSENGILQIVRAENEIVGIVAKWGLKQSETRFSYIDSDFKLKAQAKKPYMMARLLDVAKAVEQIKLADMKNKPTLTVEVDLKDEMIEQNNGLFVWTILKDGSTWEKADKSDKHEPVEPIVDISVSTSSAEFMQFIFGYAIPSGFEKLAPLIKVYDKVLLDEVV